MIRDMTQFPHISSGLTAAAPTFLAERSSSSGVGSGPIFTTLSPWRRIHAGHGHRRGLPESLKLSGGKAPPVLLGYLIIHFFDIRLTPLPLRRGDTSRRLRSLAPRLLGPSRRYSYIFRRHRDRLRLYGFELARLDDFSRRLPAQDPRGLPSFRHARGRPQDQGYSFRAHRWGGSTSAGVLTMAVFRHQVASGLPLSAGVTIYVAASNLIPKSMEPATQWPCSSFWVQACLSCWTVSCTCTERR